MQKQIAVISAHHDAHIPFVEKHLGQAFIRIDPQHLLDGSRLTVSFDGTSQTVTFDGKDITRLHGVWYRKPQPIRAADIPVTDDYKEYSRHALERLIRQLLTAFPDANWISDYFTQIRANNKTLQLRLAQECGFAVAPTIFTSDKNAAAAFIKQYGRCISKPLGTEFPMIDGKQKVLMSTLIGDGFVPNLDQLHLAPTIFQKAINVDIEVRATVVDTQVFAAVVDLEQAANAVNSDIQHRIRDNRSRHHNDVSKITAIDLPQEIAEKCVRHCAMLGMPYGALDLIRDTSGVWWFLENNPNGQWAYIEVATGQPIGKAIANYLQK